MIDDLLQYNQFTRIEKRIRYLYTHHLLKLHKVRL